MEPTGEAADAAAPRCAEAAPAETETAPPRRTSYEAYAYRSDPRHRQYEVDSVACKRQYVSVVTVWNLLGVSTAVASCGSP